MPILIITPDMSAETGLGAAGCASGSQPCSGHTPALIPKPARATPKQSVAAAPEGRAADHAANSTLPVSRTRIPNKMKSSTTLMCEATRYVKPAARTRSSCASNVTRKYEARNITSHATRKATASRASTTSAIAAMRISMQAMAGPTARWAATSAK